MVRRGFIVRVLGFALASLLVLGWVGVIAKSSQSARNYQQHLPTLPAADVESVRIMHYGSMLTEDEASHLAAECDTVGGELIFDPHGSIYQCEVR